LRWGAGRVEVRWGMVSVVGSAVIIVVAPVISGEKKNRNPFGVAARWFR